MCIRDRNKAAFYQADTEQVSNLLGIFGVIFISFHSLDPFRVGDDDTDAPLFQDIEHGHPILSGRLHAHIHTVVFMEPVSKPVQIRIKCGESFLLIAWLQTVLRCFDDGCHQKRFVNINPAADWEYDFQSTPSSFQCGEEEAVTEPPSN